MVTNAAKVMYCSCPLVFIFKSLNLNHSILMFFRCKLSEKMFLACQALKMHLGDSTALSSKELVSYCQPLSFNSTLLDGCGEMLHQCSP